MRVPARLGAAGVMLAAAGCQGIQSALDPAGPNAREIATLWWAMAAAAALIFALVLGSLLYAVYGRGPMRARIKPMNLIIGGGIILPVVVLTVLVPFNIKVASGVTEPRAENTMTIRVHGRQWWWDVEYDDRASGVRFTTANEIWLPLNEPVEIILTSADVIHSLWFPKLGGKLDLIPGRRNRLMMEADTEGVFRGQCAEFCGVGHAKMALYAVAVTRERFNAWAQDQSSPAREPPDELSRRGADLFAATGCPLCHAVRGHGAWGRVGPDLTHVGSRMTIGAGLIDNTRDNLALWIAHNDVLKRGNRMPDFDDLSRERRLAIGAYLESLE
ncbi:MAG: cytochrome c oxidase subunit II [Woeseia sp.]